MRILFCPDECQVSPLIVNESPFLSVLIVPGAACDSGRGLLKKYKQLVCQPHEITLKIISGIIVDFAPK